MLPHCEDAHAIRKRLWNPFTQIPKSIKEEFSNPDQGLYSPDPNPLHSGDKKRHIPEAGVAEDAAAVGDEVDKLS